MGFLGKIIIELHSPIKQRIYILTMPYKNVRHNKANTQTQEMGQVSERITANAGSISLSNEAGFISPKAEGLYMKKYHASFEVKVGKDGGLYASDMEQGIFTDGMTREELVKNIHEAVECHFDVPSYEKVNINIKY